MSKRPRQSLEGTSIGGYLLEREIAAGGAGAVYRAVSGDQQVALKVLHAQLGDPEEEERFRREAEVRIEHPNVVKVLDAGVDGSRAFIVFELLEGESLTALFKKRTASPRELVDWGKQVCRGLSAAHQMGLIHRDIKPGNLLCCSDGTVKILDFGIALRLREQIRMTATDTVLGTPWYLAPEQVRGDRDLDHGVDLWALGAVMYEGLARRAPFERDSVLELAVAIVREEPQPLVQFGVSPELAAVVERCLIKKRSGRWASAEALEQALSELDLEGLQAQAQQQRVSGQVPIGESRVVAVLLAEGIADPQVFEEAVSAKGGAYTPLAGGCGLGVFGGESWEGDEVERAAEAGLIVRPLSDRVAVAAGRANGPGLGKGGGISGEALHAAEQGCRADLPGVAMYAATARGLSKKFRLRSEDRSSGLVQILSLLEDEKTVRQPRQSSLQHPPTEEMPLVGRQAELAQLESEAENALYEGRAGVLYVVGPAGIGKSRLHDELLRMVEESDEEVSIYRTHADALGRAAGLSLLARALQHRAFEGHRDLNRPRLSLSASMDERREAVRALATEAIEDLEIRLQSMPFLGELLGVEMPEEPALVSARQDAQLMADRLRVAIFDYFEGLCEQRTVCLLVEDAHWADSASLDVLEELVERLADLPFLLLVTARSDLDERRPNFMQRATTTRVEPQGIGVGDVETLARALVGRPIATDLARAVVRHTSGNPLFVEQVLMALADEDLLDRDPKEGLPLPVTMEAAIQSRLDQLPLLEKNLCRRAAVLQRDFSADELGGLGIADADGLLHNLRLRGLVSSHAVRGDSGPRFVFSSALFAQVGYKMLSDPDRIELHRRAAHVLAGSGAGDEEIASHHERGAEAVKACGRYTAATFSASRRGDGETVVRCSDRALALGDPGAEAFGLHLARSDAFQFLARFQEQARALEAAEAAAADSGELGRAHADRIGCMWYLGKKVEALAAAEQAVACGEQAGDAALLALALARRAGVLTFVGEMERAEGCCRRARALASQVPIDIQATIAGSGATLARVRGELGAAREGYRLAIAYYTEAGDLRRAARNEVNLAGTDNRFADYTSAERVLRAALEKNKRVGNRLGAVGAAVALAFSICQLGRPEEALYLLEKVQADAAATGVGYLVSRCDLQRARALHLLGELEAALGIARALAVQGESLGDYQLQVCALTLELQILRQQGEHPQMRKALAAGLAVVGHTEGVVGEDVEFLLAAADAYRSTENVTAAQELEARAAEILARLASHIASDALRAQFLSQVAVHAEILKRLPPERRAELLQRPADAPAPAGDPGPAG
ncbi:MAG: protein kinase [Myxococcota bacterium]